MVKNSPKRFIAKVAKDMVDKREISTRLGTARREGAEQERKKFEARDKKIAEYLRSNGVPENIISGGFALK
ncbi:MAG: hypothetical protein IKS97_11875 [Fibrobacter sp.]|nr:hypothetical protein [Fibrobacter sp.]